MAPQAPDVVQPSAQTNPELLELLAKPIGQLGLLRCSALPSDTESEWVGPSGGTIRLSAWENISEGGYSFEVRDTGIGIAPKDIAKAMAAFGQVDSALSRKYEGTGLGLPLTKKFVELMGGKFLLESEVNVGTTITFSLPKVIAPSEDIVIKQLA